MTFQKDLFYSLNIINFIAKSSFKDLINLIILIIIDLSP